MKLLLGIDFGTGGCKVSAIRAKDGALAGEASVEYATHHEHPGWSEQDPADWWEALRAALAKLAGKGVDLSRVAALSLDGSTHNAVLLGADWKPVRRTIMWTDQRSTAECEALRGSGAAERIFGRCYQMPAPTWTLPQLAQRGYQPSVPVAAGLTATPITLEGSDGKQYWLGFQNYYAITRYNNSKMYAMAVYQLSQAIAGKEVPGA